MPSLQPVQNANDAEVVARVRLGDQSAMAVLYDRYSRVVYSVALRVLSDGNAAEDVLQDVFMQLWRNPNAFDASRGNLGAWLAVISRHRAIDQLRKKRPEADCTEIVVAAEPCLESSVQRDEAVQKVRNVLKAIPNEQRVAIEMAFFEGLTHSEIASKTGQPLGTVKTRIRAGLLALRKAFSA